MQLQPRQWTVQPLCSEEQERHPRFSDYCSYRSGMANQGLVATNFERWLDDTERYEQGSVTVVNVTIPGNRLRVGWHILVYGPRHRLCCTLGPYSNKPLADYPPTNLEDDRHA